MLRHELLNFAKLNLAGRANTENLGKARLLVSDTYHLTRLFRTNQLLRGHDEVL